MNSGLYPGTIRHRRLSPREHSVQMPLYLLLLDHDELERPDGPTRRGGALGPERWWPARYRRTDYLDGDPSTPLGDSVRDLVEARTGRRPLGPVQTLTQVRTEGYVFNPLTVHYCLAPDAPVGAPAPLEVVVLEVTNTPWHERHCYVVDARPDADLGARPGPVAAGRVDGRGRMHAELPKRLHVSPFMGMDQVYELTCSAPGDRLWLRLESFETDEHGHSTKVFDADLVLRHLPLTRRTLGRALLRTPLLTYRVWAGIHAHALLLAAKRVPFVRHPNRAGDDGPREVDSGAHRKGARTP